LRLGVDLAIRDRSMPGPFDTWFTPAERRWLQHQNNPAAVTLLWTIKQACYKIDNRGERFVPRRYEVTIHPWGDFGCSLSGRLQQLDPEIVVMQQDDHVGAVAIVSRQREPEPPTEKAVPQWKVLRIGKS
jgi:phosphopantetheinyl transferase